LNLGLSYLKSVETDILLLAEQCPLDGGEAVYQARALAFALDKVPNIDEWENCSVGTTLPRSSNEIKPDVNVFPNPATEAFQVTSKDRSITSVSVLDLLGRVLTFQDYSGAPDNMVEINTSQLKPGIYTVVIEVESTENITRLISIQ